MPDITPQEAAAVYLWAIGDGQRQPPPEPAQMHTVGSGLHKLVQIAGDAVHEHAEKTGPTIGGEPAVDRIRSAMRSEILTACSDRVEPSGTGFLVAGKQIEPWTQPSPAPDPAKARSAMALTLNSLPFVVWDRCVVHNAGTVAYGWIPRIDGRFDFVVVEFDGAGELASFTTSSATRSHEIYRILIGGDGHTECQRITDVFGDTLHNYVGAA